jgi:hypothetical protein
MEPVGSLLNLQGPATGPYPKTDDSSTHPPTLHLYDPF